jgi:hypothetical protein
MSLAENISERLTYKAYASGAITAGSEPDPSSAPGASGGQVLRYIDHTLSLVKDTYASTEKRIDRQMADMRHGTRRVQGQVNGELSPLTYSDLFEGAFRGTWAGVSALDASDLTSISADNVTSKFTAAAGNPVTLGLRVGMVIRFSGLADADNNSKNFLILAFGGTQNREMTVYPAPDTMSPDTSFTLTPAGQSLIIPSSAHESRLFAFESYKQDVDIATLYKQCRIGGFDLNLPPSGLSRTTFDVLGRNFETFATGSSPFFTAPAAQTTTGLCAAVDGVLRVNGSNIGVVTGLQMKLDLSPAGPQVLGTDLVPEIFLGKANLTGQFSAFFEDATLIEAFNDETEIQLLSLLETSSAANSPAISIFLPRIKLGSANESDDGSGGKIVQYNFQALKYQGTTASTGIEATTIQMVDTEVS